MKRYFFYLLVLMFSSVALAQTAPEENGIVKQRLFIDSDDDGVDDTIDECYKTPPNTKVDEKGCFSLINDLKTIRINVKFDIDSSVIKPEFSEEIEKVAKFLKANPIARAVIEGHTDSDGSHAYNQALSQRRAQAIARALIIDHAIASIRLTAIGFGESKPLVPNNSLNNKAINRRSVAVIRSLTQSRQ